MHTALRSLAARVVARNSHLDPFPNLPLDAPTWNSRVKWIPKQEDWDYLQATIMLTNLCKEGQITNIFSEGILSNKNCEDGKQVGAASAVLYHNRCKWKHIEKIFGEIVTEYDTALCSFILALDIIADFMHTQPNNSQHNILVFLSSNSAVNRVLDASPHEEQAASIESLKRIGELINAHLNLNIQLLWLPRTAPSVSFKRAKQLALEAIHTANLRDIEELHTIKDQKKKTKAAAITT